MEKYGANSNVLTQSTSSDTEASLFINNHWPNRCWLEGTLPNNDNRWLQNLPTNTIIPTWNKLDENGIDDELENQLINNHWQNMLEQTAMYLPIKTKNKMNHIRDGFTLKPLSSDKDITAWLDIVSDSFGYQIDRIVIDRLISETDVKILMATYQNKPAASALLYKTGDVIGLHQMGVKSEFQGQGLAKIFMLKIIDVCQQWQGKNIVLQASQAGKPLYEKLGFISQFIIKSYQYFYKV
jgi:GNAT superfamily N-acetyltransferase